MTKTIRVSDGYHALLKAHNREGETMEETLRRIMGGPDPRVLAEAVDEENAARLASAVERLGNRDREQRHRLQSVFEDESTGE